MANNNTNGLALVATAGILVWGGLRLFKNLSLLFGGGKGAAAQDYAADQLKALAAQGIYPTQGAPFWDALANEFQEKLKNIAPLDDKSRAETILKIPYNTADLWMLYRAYGARKVNKDWATFENPDRNLLETAKSELDSAAIQRINAFWASRRFGISII